ncbi:hypothetical protein FQR65_LT09561 [Abscondita terminalis]|nr:hypothetical protein FQR65_LT09561 [Abscondita terminalis]
MQTKVTLETSYRKFTVFKLKYQKNYTNEMEESFRFKIFNDNLFKISDHNERFEEGLVTYSLRISMWSDLLEYEYIETATCVQTTNMYLQQSGKQFLPPRNITLRSHVDWRDENSVTPVKDQRFCNSCWAYSAIGAIEGQNFLKNDQLINLSAQYLINCDVLDNGCKTGSQLSAYKFIQDNEGIISEESYHYTGVNKNCNSLPKDATVKISGYREILQGNEHDLQAAVATIGPIAASVDGAGMQHYSGGIFDNRKCSSVDVNIAVLVVGYGTTHDHIDYWIVKNSWGTSWGENGYIYMLKVTLYDFFMTILIKDYTSKLFAVEEPQFWLILLRAKITVHAEDSVEWL